MTYVVTENCIKCKYTDCVEVCPVDCFYAGENFLVIDLDACIDCGVCEPGCPADAIVSYTDPRATPQWLTINATYARHRDGTLGGVRRGYNDRNYAAAKGTSEFARPMSSIRKKVPVTCKRVITQE